VRLSKLVLTIALSVLTIAIVAAPALAGEPSIPQLKKDLRHARQARERAEERATSTAADLAGARELAAATSALAAEAVPDPAAVVAPPLGMNPSVAAGLLADGVVSADEIAALQKRAAKAKKNAHRWNAKVRDLKRRIRDLVRIERWNRQGKWKPLIEIAGKKYGVSRAGLTRMMMLESNGQRHVDSGPYHGLFQFMDREWAMSWNEWRDHSIYDGWSQIQLAAKCISRGMGPSIWPLTYRMAF
jgi:soluble lytic murein transglycosylase-like protein